MNTIQTELNEMNTQVVASILGIPVTRGEFDVAFTRVANKANWKMPIDAIVVLSSDVERLTLAEAVKFFAGCVPTFEVIRLETNCSTYRVKAAGYYAAVGA